MRFAKSEGTPVLLANQTAHIKSHILTHRVNKVNRPEPTVSVVGQDTGPRTLILTAACTYHPRRLEQACAELGIGL